MQRAARISRLGRRLFVLPVQACFTTSSSSLITTGTFSIASNFHKFKIPMGAAFSSAANTFDMGAAKDKVIKLTAEPLVVFSKSYCPYCTASKKLLTQLGYKYDVYELDQEEDGNDVQAALAEITGQRTVPNIFIGGKSVGGNSDLQSLNTAGKLAGLLTGANAVKA